MNLDDLPDQLEELFDRARAGLDQQIGKARTAVDSLNAEKAVAVQQLSELREEYKRTEAELETARAHLNKASTARQLDGAVAKARAELEKLNDETAAEQKALKALTKQRKAEEARVSALADEARTLTAQRVHAQETIERIKSKMEQWPTLSGV